MYHYNFKHQIGNGKWKWQWLGLFCQKIMFLSKTRLPKNVNDVSYIYFDVFDWTFKIDLFVYLNILLSAIYLWGKVIPLDLYISIQPLHTSHIYDLASRYFALRWLILKNILLSWIWSFCCSYFSFQWNRQQQE